tara:strand:+ start:400 stop:813 length:414 start_codon:yes stop_codon:yes gene_type:complete
MSEAILKKGKSYLVEVETYGMGYRNMFLHMPDSDFSALEDEAHRLGKEDKWYEYLDDETRYDFSDDLKEGTLDEILFTCIGHDLGFQGEIKDYEYIVIDVIDIHEAIIENDNIDELRVSFKMVWDKHSERETDDESN